jgi:hypothetical protein
MALGIGLWIHYPDPDSNQYSFASLQATMNSFGSLEWEFSESSKTIDIMDVHVRERGYKYGLVRKKNNSYE